MSRTSWRRLASWPPSSRPPSRWVDFANLVATLALTVAGRILEAEVADDPTCLVAVLEQAIATVNGSPEVRVLLHPAAVRPIREAWEATHGTAWLGKTWHFEADRSLPPGGCLLRYQHGFVDAGIEAQLPPLKMPRRAITTPSPGRAGGHAMSPSAALSSPATCRRAVPHGGVRDPPAAERGRPGRRTTSRRPAWWPLADC